MGNASEKAGQERLFSAKAQARPCSGSHSQVTGQQEERQKGGGVERTSSSYRRTPQDHTSTSKP